MRSMFISVRGRLIGLVILSFMPALALIIYNGIEQRNLAIKQASDSAREYINQISRDQSLIFQKAEQLLNALAVIPSINRFQLADCNALLSKLINEYRNYVSFTVFDRKGDLKCSGPPPRRMFNIADRTHFINAMQSGSAAIGDYVVSRLLGTPSVYVAHPIKDNSGIVIGTVNAGLDLQWLDLLVHNRRLKYDAELTLFDLTGTVFASYTGNDNGSLQIGDSLPEFDFVSKHIKAGSNEHIELEENRSNALKVIKPLSNDNFNAYLLISMPMEAILAEANTIFKRNLYLLFVVGLLVMMAAWFMGDLFILRFVDSLTSATRKLHGGNLSVRTDLPSGNSEFHELAKDFDRMADVIQQRDEDRIRTELALRKLATGTHWEGHQIFIQSLIRDLTQALEMDYSFVGIISDDRRVINTTVVYGDGKFIDNFSYALKGTPCQDVLIDSICIVPDDAHIKYSDDQILIEMGFRSYVGAILKDAKDKAIGVTALLSRSKLKHENLAQSLLPVFASRIGIEIDQLRLDRERSDLFEELKIAATAFESYEGMFITNANFEILRVNKAFVDITGFYMEDVLYKTPSIFAGKFEPRKLRKVIDVTGRYSAEMIYKNKKKVEIHVSQSASAVMNDSGEIINYVFHFQNISDRKRNEEKIKHMAYHDSLTNLPNRILLMDRLSQALSMSKRNGNFGALMYLDLDNFKDINDTLGHSAGDKLLVEVTERFSKILRVEDTIARLGGDEFVVLSPQLSNDMNHAMRDATIIAEKLLHSVEKPFNINKKIQHVGVSIGIVLFPKADITAEDVLKKADMAMYNAKAGGRKTIRFFRDEMQKNLIKRTQLADELIHATKNDQFLLYYQPKLEVVSGEIIGCEALIRWLHPNQGLILPLDFIPLLEETGMIGNVGQWVLREACSQHVENNRRFNGTQKTLQMAVNVSPKQFRDASFVDSVTAVINETNINPEYLELEITEGILMHDIEEAIVKMNKIKDMGVKFSIDDFGTGYSSLQYIKRLPIDSIKIDQTFIRDGITDANDKAIVIAIIKMAKSLGYSVVAEGVIDEQSLAFLAEYECDYYQGFYHSQPASGAEYLNLLTLEAREKIKFV